MRNRQDTVKFEERTARLKNELEDMADAVANGTVGDSVTVGYRSRAVQILREFNEQKVDHAIIGNFLEAAARTAGFPYTPGARINRVEVGPIVGRATSGTLEGSDAGDRNLAEAITSDSAPSAVPATEVAPKAV
jgi:hypothetical protein